MLNRLKEKSTWAAILSFLSLMGIQINDNESNMIIEVGLALSTILAFVAREIKKND